MRLNIGRRLILCFALIIVSMLLGDAVVLWQFQIVRHQAENLNGFDQELAAVLRIHSDLLTFHDKLEEAANQQDARNLAAVAETLNRTLIEDTQQARNALNAAPSGVPQDPTILPTLEVIRTAIQSQFAAITGIANQGDWGAVNVRLAYQVRPLEYSTSALVERVDREVSEQQRQVALNIEHVQRRVFMVVPITVLLTLAIALTLGIAITRSITRPLDHLMKASKTLALGEFDSQVSIDGEGELAQLGQVFNDTARQLRDLYASLQSSEDRLRRVINTIPAHVWSTRPDGSVDFINERVLESTGLPQEELMGARWRSILHPDDLPGYTEEWSMAVASGHPAESEVRMRTANLDYRWMLVRNVPLRDAQGKITKWYGTGIDIEDRKRAEEQLRRSEAYLAEAQRLSRTGSFGWTVPSGEVFWSEETYQIFGYDTAVKPSLERVLDRTHPDDRKHMQQLLDRVSSNDPGFDTEHRLLMPDGAIKFLHVVAHSTRNSSGVLEFIGAVTDTTPAMMAEEALRKAQADLAHVNRVNTMGELSATLAHEINQPIAGAQINASTCVRWLKRENPSLDEAAEAATRMIRDVNRAADIISRVRQFFRKGTLQSEPVDINELIREMVVLLQNEATRFSVRVRTELAQSLPVVVGDGVQLQQVLMNLMINSIDAMKNVDGPRLLTLHSRQGDQGEFLVSVEDTGIGLPPNQEDQIFNAFFTTKGHGTGMGLKVSRTIIEAHGGRLWATENSPRGASFHFTLATQAKVKESAVVHSRSAGH